jgi:hypothetical protein
MMFGRQAVIRHTCQTGHMRPPIGVETLRIEQRQRRPRIAPFPLLESRHVQVDMHAKAQIKEPLLASSIDNSEAVPTIAPAQVVPNEALNPAAAKPPVNSLRFIPLAFSADPVAARHAGDLDSPDHDRKPLYLKISQCGRFLVASDLGLEFSIPRPDAQPVRAPRA